MLKCSTIQDWCGGESDQFRVISDIRTIVVVDGFTTILKFVVFLHNKIKN